MVRPDLDLLLPDGQVRFLCGRRLLYIDEGHLSDEGAAWLRPLFATALTEALGDSQASTAGVGSSPREDVCPSPAAHSSHDRSWMTNWSRPR